MIELAVIHIDGQGDLLFFNDLFIVNMLILKVMVTYWTLQIIRCHVSLL